MSLEWVESFDWSNTVAHYARKYDYSNGLFSITGGARTGAYCLTVGTNGDLRKYFASKVTRIAGFGFNFVAAVAEKRFLQFNDTGVCQVSVAFDGATNRFKVYRGASVALLGTSATAFLQGQWYHVQFKATIDNTAGSFELRVNGVNVLSASGVDTQATANATCDQIQFVSAVLIDDLWVCNSDGAAYNDFLGDIKVLCAKPNGAGGVTQWTPSAGANWQCVDEIPPTDDTDYVSSSTPGQIDTYAMENPALSGAILGVQVNVMARKDDAGTRTLRTIYRQGTTNYPGSDVTLNTTYQTLSRVMETDPATGSNWIAADVNSAEFGQEITA